MPKEFTIPPVTFPSSTPSPTPTTTTTPSTNPPPHLHHRQPPTAPFQPPRPSSNSLPFMSFDIASTSSTFPPPSSSSFHTSASSSSLFSGEEPSLLEELEINPSLIWRKTLALLHPFRINPSLHSDPDLSGPFLYYFAFSLFQLLAGKVQFGVILGWLAISSIFLYSILNFLAGKNGNLDLYRSFSVVGYCLLPIVIYSAASLFLPPTATTAAFLIAAVFVVWATRVSSRLLAVDELGASEHRALIAVDQTGTDFVASKDTIIVCPHKPQWDVFAAFGTLKGGRADWLVEKCTLLSLCHRRALIQHNLGARSISFRLVVDDINSGNAKLQEWIYLRLTFSYGLILGSNLNRVQFLRYVVPIYFALICAKLSIFLPDHRRTAYFSQIRF